ncbi:MAG: BamA/TamA family outer membrane protein [Bacteroidales bacterium]
MIIAGRAKYILFLILFFIVGSCSTTKVIPTGESRLKANKVIIENSKQYQASNLQPYIKQKPNTYFIFGWNPFLNIYNWSNNKNNGWDRFVKKLGQEPVVFDKDLVVKSCKNMNNHLIYDGYYNSAIRDSIYTKNRKTTVTYKVMLGKRYTLNNISYVISNPLLKEKFYADTANSFIKKGNILSESLLERESERVAAEFRNKGYFGFTKNYFFFEADTLMHNNLANLNIRIEDYTRNELPKDAKPHSIFLINDVNITAMRNLSQQSRVIRKNLDSLNVDTLVYDNINIIYPGKPLLRSKVIARMNLVKPGATYDEQAVSNTYRRFANMKLFSSVNVQMNEVDSAQVDCNIKLTASALQGYKINLEASSNSTGLLGISPTVSYYHKNLFRGGELFSLSFMGDFQFKVKSPIRSTEFGISTSISVPNFLLLPDRIFKSQNIPRTEISLSYNYQDRPEYTRNIISGSYGYSWNVGEKFFYKISPLQVNIVKLYNLSESFYESLKDPFLKNSYQDHFDLGLGTSLYYTTDASSSPKNSYFYLRWQNDLSGNVVSLFNNLMKKNSTGERLIWDSPYSQYYRTEISAVYTWKFGKLNKQALASRVLIGAGTGYGNSISLPFEKLFWAGGAYSLRAWQARTVGPGSAQIDTAFTIPNQTGDIRFEANIEYRFPLFWTFDGAIFMDAGNVWTLKHNNTANNEGQIVDINSDGVFKFNNFYKHIALDWGVGLRLNLGFALLRLDLGLKLYNPPTNEWYGPQSWFKNKNYGLQFGVGYPF